MSDGPRAGVAKATPPTGLSLPLDRGQTGSPAPSQEDAVPVPQLVSLLLMVFVLLAPTMMVAVLLSGLSRRPTGPETDEASEADAVEALGVSR